MLFLWSIFVKKKQVFYYLVVMSPGDDRNKENMDGGNKIEKTS